MGLPENIQAAAFSPADEKTIWVYTVMETHTRTALYLSQDGGQTFKSVISEQGKLSIDARTLTPDPHDQDIIYFASNGTNLVRYNHKTRQTSIQNCQQYIASILYSPASPSLIYLGFTGRGIFLEED